MLKKTLFIILTLFALQVKAQETKVRTFTPDENTIVRGDDGMVYPYKKWKDLLLGGKYVLKSRGTYADNGAPEYLLHEITEAEQTELFKRRARPRTSESFKEGELFEGFKATDINGNKFDVRKATGKVVVLNFWFINCPPCKKEIPQLNELVKSYQEHQDVIFLAVALDDKYALRDFIKTTPFDYNIVDGRPIANKYAIKGYPTHVVIDRMGKIKFSTLGLASNTIFWIKKSIDESLTAQ